ncbi:MAG TPA: Na+ cotransporter [Gammaproteobacteria bacterium]|nr:Na+ cotransporter [Gammaproteobacteria bacterium]
MTLLGLILNLVAAAILLIWSVKLVQAGIEKAYGSRIRRALQQADSRRFQAAIFGSMLAILLQSSTAVAVLAASFASTGLIAPSVGIAAVLGADLGSALVLQILSFNLSWLIPICLIAGGIGFFKGKTPGIKQTGRVLVGIALILISLSMLTEATRPLQYNTFIPLAVDYLKVDPIAAFLIGGIFTWLIHSSIAALLLIIAFVAQGIIPFVVAVALVLGANVGGAFIAVSLTRRADKAARLVPMGNLILRGFIAILLLIAVEIWPISEKFLEEANVQYLVGFHVGLNFALVVLGLPLVGRVEIILDKLISSDDYGSNGVVSNRQSILEDKKTHIPTHALTSTTRELLYLSELVQKMFEPVMELFEKWDKPLINELKALELEVNSVHQCVKDYVTEVIRHNLTEEELRRSHELVMYADNMEAAGDVIVKNLFKLAATQNKKALIFSDKGREELTTLHDQILVNMQLAMNVLLSSDLESARQLVQEKGVVGTMVLESHRNHLDRLRDGDPASLRSSNIHIETLRALRQVNSAFSSIAYSLIAEDSRVE